MSGGYGCGAWVTFAIGLLGFCSLSKTLGEENYSEGSKETFPLRMKGLKDFSGQVILDSIISEFLSHNFIWSLQKS